MPGAVCSTDTCNVSVYPDMFEPNMSILGVFTYDGYGSSSNSTPGSGGWGGVFADPGIGTVIPPNINFENAQSGFYFFTNTVTDAFGCVSSSQTIVQVVAALDGGQDAVLDYCTNDTDCIDLFVELGSPDPLGSWTSIGDPIDIVTGSCFYGLYQAAGQATVNITDLTEGTYIFEYTITNPPAQYPIFNGCVGCSGTTATVTINITQQQMAGIIDSTAVCN